MRLHPGAWLVLLTLTALQVRAGDVRDEVTVGGMAEVVSGGKPVAPAPRPRVRLKLDEAKSAERKTAAEKDPEILVLPKVEVTAPKVEDTPFEKHLEAMDQEEAREERSTKLSWLEALLNGKAFANVRTAQARERVKIMGWERVLTIALLAAKTDEERAKIRAEIEVCKDMRR